MGDNLGMAQASGYVGERVRWLGPPQSGFVTDAYRAALAAGEHRVPTPAETQRLATGEPGTVTEVLRVDDAGYHMCVIVFDGGHELEVLLPAPTLVKFVDHPPLTADESGSRRYVSASRRGLRGITHQLLQAMHLAPR